MSINGGEKQSELWQLVDALQREAGGGCAKAVNITIFFDRSGTYVGRTEPKTVKLMPGNIMELLKEMFSG